MQKIDALLEFYQLLQVAETQTFDTGSTAKLCIYRIKSNLICTNTLSQIQLNIYSMLKLETILHFRSRKRLYILWTLTLWIGMLSREEAETRETRVGLAGARRCKLFNVQQVFYQQH